MTLLAHTLVTEDDNYYVDVAVAYKMKNGLLVPLIQEELNFCDLLADNVAKAPNAPYGCPLKPGPFLFSYLSTIPEVLPHVSPNFLNPILSSCILNNYYFRGLILANPTQLNPANQIFHCGV